MSSGGDAYNKIKANPFDTGSVGVKWGAKPPGPTSASGTVQSIRSSRGLIHNESQWSV